jgi:hypothetical protein
VRHADLLESARITNLGAHVQTEFDLATRATVTTGCTCYGFPYMNTGVYHGFYIVSILQLQLTDGFRTCFTVPLEQAPTPKAGVGRTAP